MREELSVRPPSESVAPVRRVSAFSIHVFTACGGACALLALIAATRAQWVAMFAWLGAALFIDGIDGTLARRFRISETLPRWSGDVLDYVVDFATYVFVPAFAIAAGGLLPEWTAIPLAGAIVITSAIYFADRNMKTTENYFRGFPVLWNAAAFHLFVLGPPPWIAAAIVTILIALTFTRLPVVHPVRVRRWRKLNLAMLGLWSLLGLYALATALKPGPVIAWLFTACGVYVLAAGSVSVLVARRRKR